VGVSWSGLCEANDLTVEAHQLIVALGDGRKHRVVVSEEVDGYRLVALVARLAVLASIPDAPIRSWLRNRETQLVGFRIDRRGRLQAEAWVPKTGLTAEEFQLYARTLATEADRFEFALTGKDSE
jgi:hypothetical protein